MNRSIFLVGLFIAFVSTMAIAQPSAGAAIIAVDEPALSASGGGYAGGSQSRSGSAKGTAPTRAAPARSARNKPVTKSATRPTTPRPVKPWDGFVVGDKYTFLNFEVVSAEKPYYTRAAKASGAKGLVQVEVLIDPNGNVLNAHARTGNKELHPEAERAALASKFNRPTFGGKPARAIGFLVYRFGEGDD